MKEENCTCTDECLGYLTKTCKGIEEVALRLKGKEFFKESNDRARKVLSEIKSLPIVEKISPIQQIINFITENYEKENEPRQLSMSLLKKWIEFKLLDEESKWQQERSYSEEEVIRILFKVYEDIGKRKIPNPVVLASWFEQFKKK